MTEASAASRSSSDRCAELGAAGIQAEIVIQGGRPADEIVTSSKGADLVVLGTHGHGALGRLVVGSVAEEVARRGRVPTLVVRSTEAWKRVVVAVDPLAASHDAIVAAADLARHMHVPLEAIHAAHLPALLPSGLVPALPALGPGEPDNGRHGQAAALLERHLEAAPERIRTLIREGAGVDARVRVVVGRPGDAIPEHLRPDDLLVCGTHSRSRVDRLVFGSVATKLLRRAPGPVLIVRPVEAEKKPESAPAQAEPALSD